MIVDVHTHCKKSKAEFTIISTTIAEFCSVSQTDPFTIGIHPWHANKNWQKDLPDLKIIAAMKNCLGIGECGLDKSRKMDFQLQKEIFQYQIELAENLNKPVIIHCVKAFDELCRIAKKHSFKTPWLIHGFRANIQITEQLLKFKKIYFSFGEALTFSEKTQNSFKKVPLQRLMLETDESGINIDSVYEKAAELLHLELKDLETVIENNTNKFFNLKL